MLPRAHRFSVEQKPNGQFAHRNAPRGALEDAGATFGAGTVADAAPKTGQASGKLNRFNDDA